MAFDMIARVTVSDKYRATGETPPYGLERKLSHPPAVVTWRSEGCPKRRCRLLRVFTDSYGWYLIGNDFKESAPRWLDRVNSENNTDWTLDDRVDRVDMRSLRHVVGVRHTLPLDFDLWPERGHVTVGCDHAGGFAVGQDLLLNDCRITVATREPVVRAVRPGI